MNDRLRIVVLLAAAIGAFWFLTQPTASPDCPDGRCPAPARPNLPKPAPRRPCPCPADLVDTSFADAGEMNGPGHDGVEVNCDLPTELHLKNRGGSDGAGLCVFASLTHAGQWCDEPVAQHMFEFMFTRPGGGYPTKVDAMLKACAAEMRLPVPSYIQHTGGDPEFIERALATYRYVSCTYDGRDTAYGGVYSGRIAHMVNCVYLGQKWAVVHDNNTPGRWLWLPRAAFLERWKGGGGGWAVVLLRPGPPPIPTGRPGRMGVDGTDRIVRCADGPAASAPTLRCADAAQGYSWLKHLDSWVLYHNGVQIGGYNESLGYRSLKGGVWSAGTVEPPPGVDLPGGDVNKYGVLSDRVPKEKSYRKNGATITREQAFADMETFSDDVRKLRLTVVGPAEMRERCERDWRDSPAFADLRDRVLFRTYDPAHWWVADVGMAPGITLQGPARADGKAPVIWRLRDYAGADNLAVAIRQADPSYQPSRDADPNANLLSKTYKGIPIWALVLAVVAVLWVVFGSSQRKE